MAINDRFMLPKRVRTMEQMADLLAAEQEELDQIQHTITAQETQLTISTSTYLLSRHEQLFALPVNTIEGLEMRRAKVLAKLNTQGITTVRSICDMVEIITGQKGGVIEYFDEYAFSVLIKLLDTATISTVNMQELIRQIEEIKPAHLVFDFILEITGPSFLETPGHLIFRRFAMAWSFSAHRSFPPVRLDGTVLLDGSALLNAKPSSMFGFPRFRMSYAVQDVRDRWKIPAIHYGVTPFSNREQAEMPEFRTWIPTAGNRRGPAAFSTPHLRMSSDIAKNQQSVSRVSLTVDTMYTLDGAVLLDGSRNLNADITKEEL